jgi:MFS-type transporter involved in bile tolerance (Atg22 family)
MQGLSDGLAAQIMPWFADLGRSDNVGTTMGLYRLAQDLGSFFGPILITYVSGYYDPNLITFPSLFISSVIAMVAGIITMKVDDPKIG